MKVLRNSTVRVNPEFGSTGKHSNLARLVPTPRVVMIAANTDLQMRLGFVNLSDNTRTKVGALVGQGHERHRVPDKEGQTPAVVQN